MWNLLSFCYKHKVLVLFDLLLRICLRVNYFNQVFPFVFTSSYIYCIPMGPISPVMIVMCPKRKLCVIFLKKLGSSSKKMFCTNPIIRSIIRNQNSTLFIFLLYPKTTTCSLNNTSKRTWLYDRCHIQEPSAM